MGKYKNNPWLGLESYQENQIIYGRNKEIEELSQCILNNSETVLYGKSGIGKSSILNAGILPVARVNGYIPVVIRLDHNNKYSYIKQINDQIIKHTCVNNIKTSKSVEYQILWEYFHTREFWKSNNEERKSKLLIIFDQFEEIFTLQGNSAVKSQFFKEIGDVLNDVMPKSLAEESELRETTNVETDGPIQVTGFAEMTDLFSKIAAKVDNRGQYIEDNEVHFVFALREDFLSEFEYHTSRIPSLKQHRYGLRPINEEQAAEIIMRPHPGLVDEHVARLIIETVTNRTDFSLGDEPEIDVDAAVLSLFLSQIYDKREREDDTISIDLVKTFGKDIIKDFYEESIEGLSLEQIDFMEDELLTGENRRDSLSRSDFMAGGFSKKELKILIEEKKLLRQFHYEGDLRVEFIHDVLCDVVKERREKREQLRLQEEERKRQEEETRRIQEEAERKQREITEKAAKEKAELEAEALRVRLRNRKRMLSLAATIGIILFAAVTTYVLGFMKYTEEYGNFTTVYGWPVGLGEELSGKDKDGLIVYYKLSRDGWMPLFELVGHKFGNPYTEVDVCCPDGKPTNNVFLENPTVSLWEKELKDGWDDKAKEFAQFQRNTVKWIFTPDINGNISRRTALDIANNELYSIQYYTEIPETDEKHLSVMWAVYNNKSGQQLQVRDNGMDRMRLTLQDGLETGCMFFTELGSPQPNYYGHYGYSFDVDANTNEIKRKCEVDKFGDKVNNACINYLSYVQGRCTETNESKISYSDNCVITAYKNHVDTVLFHNSNLDYLNVGIGDKKRLVVKYDEEGAVIKKSFSILDSIYYQEIRSYDNQKRLSKIDIVDKSSHPYTSYSVKYEYNKGKEEISYWRNASPIEISQIDDIVVHRKVCSKIETDSTIEIMTDFLDLAGNLVSNGQYSKSLVIKNKTGHTLYGYYYDKNGEICESEMFFYNEYGIREARAVAGIDRNPVRCPYWDSENLCYYKMYFTQGTLMDDQYILRKAVDERGVEVNIYRESSNKLIEQDIIPISENTSSLNESGFDVGLAISQMRFLSPDETNMMPYLHILSKKGTFYMAKNKVYKDGYHSRLHDGDIVVSINGWNLINNQYGTIQCEKIKELLKTNSINEIVVRRFDNNLPKEFEYFAKQGDPKAEIHYAPMK